MQRPVTGGRARKASVASIVLGVIALVIGLAGTTVGAQGGPPGNNGTVKINGEELRSGGRGNDPHVGCSFDVSFWNFDSDAGASVSFAAHPPTGRSLLLGDNFTLDSDGADGSLDASRSYNLASALIGNFEPHPVQGYHVKLTVHAEGSQGADTKHKVFWTDCELPTTTTTAPPTTTTAPPTTTAPEVSPTTVVQEVTPTTEAEVLGVVVEKPAALPQELAFTGISGMETLVLTGIMLLLFGVALELVAMRRAAVATGDG